MNFLVERINPDGTPYKRTYFDGSMIGAGNIWKKRVTAATAEEAAKIAGVQWATHTFRKVGTQWEISNFSRLDFPIFTKVTWIEDHEKRFIVDHKVTEEYKVAEVVSHAQR